MGIFYLLLAKLAGIVKVVAVKKCGSAAQGAENSVKINLIRSVGCLLVSVLVFLFNLDGMDKTGIFISLLSGICNAAFLFLWILTAERGSLCLVELFCMLGSVAIPLFLAPFLYAGERVLWYQWICAGMLFISTFLFFPSTGEKKKFDFLSILFLLGCAISSAGTVITQKLYVAYSQGTIASFNLITFSVVALVFAVLFFFFKTKKAEVETQASVENSPHDQAEQSEPSNNQVEPSENSGTFSKQIWLLIGLATIMLYLNQFLSTQAAKYFTSAVFYPLSYAIGWPLTFLADVCIFKEKTTVKKIVGLLIAICASVLISL